MIITEFKNKYSFLSNFYLCQIPYGGIIFPSSEHAYQAAKTLNEDYRWAISFVPTPGAAKSLGRSLDLRDNWEDIKLLVMTEILLIKFGFNFELRKLLLDTGDAELREGNFWRDKFWGVDLKTGEGENWLGHILMDIRGLFR